MYVDQEDVEDVEEAVEADEKLVFDPAEDETEESIDEEVFHDSSQDESDGNSHESMLNRYLLYISLIPVAILAILQILPFPPWIIGFTTGILIGVTVAVLFMWIFCIRDSLTSKTKFVDNVKRRIPRRPAIIVQEELARKFVS